MKLNWIPNAISIARILLIIPVLELILRQQYDIALLLFVIAGLSDGLDGYLAVKFNWVSRFGALLDPVADKLLMAGMFLTLSHLELVPLWLAAVVIGRDIVIIAGAMAYNFIVGPVPGEPTLVSKLNTALELFFLFFVLTRAAYGWPDGIVITVLGASILITVVISGTDYVLSWSRKAREQT
ncbi:MAG: CDP-alcohol phosphatidyltransferase family protein [Pseudomonadota bacterium]